MTHLVRKWDEDSSVQAYHCTSLMRNYTKGDSPVECLYDLVVKRCVQTLKVGMEVGMITDIITL